MMHSDLEVAGRLRIADFVSGKSFLRPSRFLAEMHDTSCSILTNQALSLVIMQHMFYDP